MTYKFQPKKLLLSSILIVFLSPIFLLADTTLTCNPGNLEICSNIKIIGITKTPPLMKINQDNRNSLSKRIEQEIEILNLINPSFDLYKKNVKQNHNNALVTNLWNDVLNNRFMKYNKNPNKPVENALRYYLTSFNLRTGKNASESFSSTDYKMIIRDTKNNNKIQPEFDFFRFKIGRVSIKNESKNIETGLQFSTRFSSILWNILLKFYKEEFPKNDASYIKNNDPDNVIPEKMATDLLNSLKNKDKNLFLKVINNDLEKIINSLLKGNLSELSKIIPFINFISLQSEVNIKNIHQQIWIDEEVNKFHSTKKRKVILKESANLTSPRVDRDTGLLELNDTHYKELLKNNLLRYALQHEAFHVYQNIHSIREEYIESFTKDPKRIIGILSKIVCDGSALPDQLSDSYSPSEMEEMRTALSDIFCQEGQVFDLSDPAQNDGKIYSLYRKVFPAFKAISEVLADIDSIDSIAINEANGYIKMLELMLPSGEREKRVNLVRKYISLKKELSLLDVPEDHLYFILLFEKLIFDKKINNISSEEHLDGIDYMQQLMFIIKKIRLEEKELWAFLNAIIKFESIYKFRTSYEKINSVLKKYRLKEAILEYSF